MDSILDLFLGDSVYDEQNKFIKRDFGIKNLIFILIFLYVCYSLVCKMKSKRKSKMKGGGVAEGITGFGTSLIRIPKIGWMFGVVYMIILLSGVLAFFIAWIALPLLAAMLYRAVSSSLKTGKFSVSDLDPSKIDGIWWSLEAAYLLMLIILYNNNKANAKKIAVAEANAAAAVAAATSATTTFADSVISGGGTSGYTSGGPRTHPWRR